MLTIIGATILLVASATSAAAQGSLAGSDRGIDAEARERLIDIIARQLHARYVLPGKVKEIEQYLRTKLKSGGYDGAVTATAFAQALTRDLRSAADDLHFDVTYDPQRERKLAAAGSATKKRLPEIAPTAEELSALRRVNYGFRKVELLPGNVGLLELDRFADLKYSRSTAAAAMGLLAHADAVIMDLRRNPGGHGNLVDFLVSYFFRSRPVELMSSYDRETNTTNRHWSLPRLPGKRLTDAGIYILTSRNTGSAAEAFAFTLQQLGRGRVVGERSAGAAHGGGWVPLTDGFIIFVPTFRGFNPRTGRSWNSVGVQPDISAPADRAAEVAYLEAVNELIPRADNAGRKQELSWLVPLLQMRAFGPKQVALARLQLYAGKYEGAEVSLEGGRLYFLGASGIRRNLHALAEDYFLIEDNSVPAENQARVQFISAAQGRVTELQLVVADGRRFTRKRVD